MLIIRQVGGKGQPGQKIKAKKIVCLSFEKKKKKLTSYRKFQKKTKTHTGAQAAALQGQKWECTHAHTHMRAPQSPSPTWRARGEGGDAQRWGPSEEEGCGWTGTALADEGVRGRTAPCSGPSCRCGQPARRGGDAENGNCVGHRPTHPPL